jgi:hypothetical protein
VRRQLRVCAGSNSGLKIGAPVTANRADETLLQVREPQVIGHKAGYIVTEWPH